MGAAGSGAAGMQGAAGRGAAGEGAGGGMAEAGSGSVDPCSSFSTATHIVLNVTWEGTYALNGGSGKVHLWSKSNFVGSGSGNGTVVGQSCGSVMPSITTTQLAGNEKILPEMLDAVWEASSMPKFTGSVTKNGNTVTVDPGVALVGCSMSNPAGAWPSAATGITGVDHDSDGKLGVTSVPKTTGGFSAPPTDLGKSHRADQVYLAIRNVMTMTSSTLGECSEPLIGTANVMKFENHVIGCHVKDGNECDSTQAKFVDENRTAFKIGSATFTSQRISAGATCAQVRAALPVQ